MAKKLSKNQRRLKVHARIRQKVQGRPERPRLVVFRSLKHLYAQLVDDESGSTLASASSLAGKGSKKVSGSKIDSAKKVGEWMAAEAKKKNIESVVFDRGGYIYHGRVKAFAESAREHGLKF